METVNEIKMIPLGDITPYEKNPRRNTKTVELLCEIIPKVGFNVPLVLDENNVIVKGHARYYAAEKLGMDKVPCVISHASPDEIKADRIADNRIFEFSQWVGEELMHEVDMLDLDINLEDFGIPTFDMPDFDFDVDFDDDEDDGYIEMSDEERKRKFAELMAQMEAEAEEVQIVTPREIESAVQKQKNTAQAPPEYLEVTCEKCGHVAFVRKGDGMLWE